MSATASTPGMAGPTALSPRSAEEIKQELTRPENRFLIAMEEIAAVVGDDFFDSAARLLGLLMDVRYVFIAECIDSKALMSRTLAFWTTEGPLANIDFCADGGPCEGAMAGRVVHYASGVLDAFPDNQSLQMLKPESYFGYPLVASTGRILGHIAAMDLKPYAPSAEDMVILKIFASRAAAELERRHLQAARAALEGKVQEAQRLESLGSMARGVAHDFNNLLLGVIGNADLALRSVAEGSPVADRLSRISTSARRAAELTRQLLTYAGQGKSETEPLDLAQLIQEMVRLLEVSISPKISVEYSLDSGLPAVEGDVGQIRQIVMNLVLNAAEAIGDDEGTIAVSAGASTIDEGDEASDDWTAPPQPGEYVRVDVADSGSGMDEETQARVFDPFFSTKFGGRGLGLPVVLGILRSHGGALRMKSAPGVGSTFSILLPVSSGELSQATTRSAGTREAKGVVLFADDEPIACELAREALELDGLRVVTAENGEQAVEVFRDHADEITAVVLDVAMPRSSGIDALERIRRIRPDVPAVLSSGYAEPDLKDRFDCSPPEFLAKPYSPEQLMTGIRRALSEQ